MYKPTQILYSNKQCSVVRSHLALMHPKFQCNGKEHGNLYLGDRHSFLRQQLKGIVQNSHGIYSETLKYMHTLYMYTCTLDSNTWVSYFKSCSRVSNVLNLSIVPMKENYSKVTRSSSKCTETIYSNLCSMFPQSIHKICKSKKQNEKN